MTKQIAIERLVVLGANSKVWKSLDKSLLLNDLCVVAIGHAEIDRFKFQPGDKVWVFSYSRKADENHRIISVLASNHNIRVFYVSSASTNVTSMTQCYNYPTVKMKAHEDALNLCTAFVVNIGWFYDDVNDLPSGVTAATSIHELARQMRDITYLPGQIVNLFKLVNRPFRSRLEKFLYKAYGELLTLCGRNPCLLRPLDLLLRLGGMRWYGYLYLSNRLWFTTI